MNLKMDDVTIKIENEKIVQNINIYVPENKFVGLVGLNGTGKSTILKAAYGINEYDGNIFLDSINIKKISTKEMARKLAVLIQENSNDFNFIVEDVVMLGRLPYKKLFELDNTEDQQIVNSALEYVGMLDYKDRYFNSLSGGEKQRVLIARVLAQKCSLLILDEPTNHLDVKNQFKLFEIIKELNFTVLAVLHDLNMAARFCDYVYVLKEGRIYSEGVPAKVFNKDTLKEVFGMEADVRKDGRGVCIEYIRSV